MDQKDQNLDALQAANPTTDLPPDPRAITIAPPDDIPPALTQFKIVSDMQAGGFARDADGKMVQLPPSPHIQPIPNTQPILPPLDLPPELTDSLAAETQREAKEANALRRAQVEKSVAAQKIAGPFHGTDLERAVTHLTKVLNTQEPEVVTRINAALDKLRQALLNPDVNVRKTAISDFEKECNVGTSCGAALGEAITLLIFAAVGFAIGVALGTVIGGLDLSSWADAASALTKMADLFTGNITDGAIALLSTTAVTTIAVPLIAHFTFFGKSALQSAVNDTVSAAEKLSSTQPANQVI